MILAEGLGNGGCGFADETCRMTKRANSHSLEPQEMCTAQNVPRRADGNNYLRERLGGLDTWETTSKERRQRAVLPLGATVPEMDLTRNYKPVQLL